MRGRPVGSEIRQNIMEILFHMKSACGYDIYKKYIEIFPKASQRSIYYHLNKGAKLKEFTVDRVVKEKGDFSWGSTAEKVYYKLGENASVKGSKRVEKFFRR